MATCRAFGVLGMRTSFRSFINFNAAIVVKQQSKCFQTAQCLCGVSPTQLMMPALSPTMEEGTISKWLKQEGDAITAGDALCEIETDKATVTLDADDDGVMAKIMIPDGTKGIQIGTLIALTVADGEDYKDIDMPSEATDATPEAETVDGVASAASTDASVTSIRQSSDTLSPAVRQLVEAHVLDPSGIPASGPHGRLLKGDVLRYLDSPDASKSKPQVAEVVSEPPPPPSPVRKQKLPIVPITTLSELQQSSDDLEISNIRRVIAKRLTESKFTIPHAYSSIQCNMNQVDKLRKQLKEESIKLSVNDFIIKAAAVTLKEIPEVNASLDNEGSIQLLPDVDISVAVATDRGLITPIVKNADGRGLVNISNTVKDLASRARDGKLQLQEFQGGSFSISNLGMFGISEFTAVINPPQSCILAVGTSRLVLSDDVAKPVAVTTVTMSSDARVVDDALAARFLEAFKRNLENPLRLGIL